MKLEKGIEIEIKASLSVDEETFKTCMNLIKIYFKSQYGDYKGLLFKFEEEYPDPIITIIATDEEVERISKACREGEQS